MSFTEQIAQRLGVDAGADEATLLAALDEALVEQAGGHTFTDDQWGRIVATLELDADATADDVVAAVEAAAGGSSGEAGGGEQVAASAGMADETRQIAAETMVGQAIDEGRFNAALRGRLVKAAVHDLEGMRTVLASVPKNTIPRQLLGTSRAPELDEGYQEPRPRSWVR